MENIKYSKLYSKVKQNNIDISDKPKSKPTILRKTNLFTKPSNTTDGNKNIEILSYSASQNKYINEKSDSSKENLQLILPKISSKKELTQTNLIKNNPSTITRITNLTKTNQKFQKNKLSKKEFQNTLLKPNVLQTIQVYLDSKSLLNFMLISKKFYKSVIENDELFFNLYIKRFKTRNTKYLDHRGKWKEYFIKNITLIHKTNYESLKSKFLKKSTKNSYTMKKDAYYLTNNLFVYMKPIYNLEIDGKQYKLKFILNDKILSHVNFFANFDENYIELDKVKKLKLSLTEKNLGIYNSNLITYEFKKISFTEFKSDSKICKIFYDNEFIISTFEKRFLFFLNISLPICKICGTCFDFLKGIHDNNLNYFDDVDSNFGLFDYSLLINIKSWNNIFFTLNVNTCDFKDEGEFLLYVNDGKSKNFST